MAWTANRRIQIIVGLFLSLGVALLPLGDWGAAYTGLGKLLGREVLWWAAVALLLLYVILAERRPFSTIGFRTPGWRDLLAAVAFGVLAVVGVVLIYSQLFPLLHLQTNAGAMQSLLSTPFWYRFLLVTRAAVSEELLFRGYPIPRLNELSGSRFVAAAISWAAFTYAHLSYWGAAQLIVAGWGGVLFTLLFVWRRNLWANMIAHWIADGAGFLLG